MKNKETITAKHDTYTQNKVLPLIVIPGVLKRKLDLEKNREVDFKAYFNKFMNIINTFFRER